MISDIIGLFTLALILTFLAVAVRNSSGTSTIISQTLSGFTGVQGAIANG
jgi:hypothetical protein